MGVLETRELTKPAHWRLKATFWLDVMVLVSFCALQISQKAIPMPKRYFGLPKVLGQQQIAKLMDSAATPFIESFLTLHACPSRKCHRERTNAS